MTEYHSPCVSVCALDENEQYCIGCMRTPQEIMEWLTYSKEKRLQVLEELKTRTFDDENPNT
jgi:predicted Fe-S protein YdhL (DUF1289 family)